VVALHMSILHEFLLIAVGGSMWNSKLVKTITLRAQLELDYDRFL